MKTINSSLKQKNITKKPLENFFYKKKNFL